MRRGIMFELGENAGTRHTMLKWRMFGCMALCLFSAVASLQPLPSFAAGEVKLTIPVIYVAREEEQVIPLSLLDLPAEKEGFLGAQLALNDNQTTGDFLGHKYVLSEAIAKADEKVEDVVASLGLSDASIIVADLLADDLLALSSAYPQSLIINSRATDDRLRNEDCRANVLHVAPSRTMLTDGLVQFLVWKKWDELVLVTGRHAEDELYAQAMRGSVKRYGLKLVEEKAWTSIPGARQTDSGHHNLQQEIPTFSRFDRHDVVLIADEADEFGEYFSYRTESPRPVAGTQGLIATSWHRSQEQWGATQIQRRFFKLAQRYMKPRDYSGWAAMRSIGEAVTQTSSNAVEDVREYILSDKFNLAGFKGVPLTYRDWNGQLRQPVLVVGPRMLVSVSPQDGFLHQVSILDTLGFDKPQSTCQNF
ncbi:MAG: ABC transporter substrate-binding protein [Granulosicoccus sp.]